MVFKAISCGRHSLAPSVFYKAHHNWDRGKFHSKVLKRLESAILTLKSYLSAFSQGRVNLQKKRHWIHGWSSILSNVQEKLLYCQLLRCPYLAVKLVFDEKQATKEAVAFLQCYGGRGLQTSLFQYAGPQKSPTNVLIKYS